MKHLTAAFLFTVSFAVASTAQKDNKNNITSKWAVSLSHGLFTIPEIFNVVGAVVTPATPQPYSNNRFFGASFITLRRNTKKNKFWYGLTAGFDPVRGQYRDDVPPGTFRMKIFTFAAEAQWTYSSLPKLRAYGFAGGGLAWGVIKRTGGDGKRSDEKIRSMNFQLTPVGVSFGRKYGWFAELGFGYKGIINMGGYVRF